MSFTVIVDTKEKQPWEFDSEKIIGREFSSLKTGDYTVKGLEHLLCIERKGSVSEIAQNIHQARFKKELIRIREFKYAYLILEASAQRVMDYPLYENLPPRVKNKIRVSGKYLMKCLNRMQVAYGFNIVYASNREVAQIIAVNLMENVIKLESGSGIEI